MSTLTEITNKLATLTNIFNTFIGKAKTTDELSLQSPINALAKIRVFLDGESQYVTADQIMGTEGVTGLNIVVYKINLESQPDSIAGYINSMDSLEVALGVMPKFEFIIAGSNVIPRVIRYHIIGVQHGTYGNQGSRVLGYENLAIEYDSHEFINRLILENFGEDADGNPTYNGVKVDTTVAQRDVYDGLDSTDNTISLAANRGKELKDVQDTQQIAINLNTSKETNISHPLVETAVPLGAVFTDNDTVYTHPANHSPSIISQDATNRFVTDAEKATWNGKEPSNVAPIADDKVTVFNSDGSKRYEDYGSGTASLLSKTKTYTSGAQTITADFDIAQVDSLLVGNTPLQRDSQYSVSGSVVTILDTLTSGAVIELNYWKANAVNATNYTKAESDAKFSDKLDKTAEIQAFVSLTLADYDAITTKSATTIYFIEE